MYLKVNSPDWIIYEWKIKKVLVPTETWEIGILKNHIPMVSVVKPWILKIEDEKKDEYEDFIKDWEYINISVSKWLIFVWSETVSVVTSSSTKSPEHSNEVMENMKKELEEKVKNLRKQWSVEELETVLTSLEKIKADMQLLKKKKK